MNYFEDIHEHEHADNEYNRYRDVFEKFDTLPSDKEVTAKVQTLLDKHYATNYTPKVLKHLHGCIDLTSLNATDTKESIWKMVDETVNNYEGTHPDVGNVAAVCIYPVFVETVKQALTAQDVKIASVVGGFPASQTFTEVKIAETAMSVLEGAEEVDTVMNLGYFLEEDYEALTDELSEIKESCRGAKLKVILETGALQSVENIRKASILALYSGADFIKTSTGKGFPGATPEAVYVMSRILKEYNAQTGSRAGIKISGGIRTPEDAVKYYTIVKEILGKDFIGKDFFRIGASSLVSELERRIDTMD